MLSVSSLVDAIGRLNTQDGSTRADVGAKELIALLESLGFVVKAGRKIGHYRYYHPQNGLLSMGNFSAGHGRNDDVKKSYVLNTIRVLEALKGALSTNEKPHV